MPHNHIAAGLMICKGLGLSSMALAFEAGVGDSKWISEAAQLPITIAALLVAALCVVICFLLMERMRQTLQKSSENQTTIVLAQADSAKAQAEALKDVSTEFKLLAAKLESGKVVFVREGHRHDDPKLEENDR